MALTTVDNSASISTTEYSLPAATTTGVPTSQTDKSVQQIWIDFGAMIAGDQYRVRLYEKVNGSGATQRQIEEWFLDGAQSQPLIVDIGFLAHGWDVTVIKIAGTDRTIGWSLRKVT